jgi:hypothetical protein
MNTMNTIFTANLDRYPDLGEGQRAAINYRNAWALFPRLAPPASAE